MSNDISWISFNSAIASKLSFLASNFGYPSFLECIDSLHCPNKMAYIEDFSGGVGWSSWCSHLVWSCKLCWSSLHQGLRWLFAFLELGRQCLQPFLLQVWCLVTLSAINQNILLSIWLCWKKIYIGWILWHQRCDLLVHLSCPWTPMILLIFAHSGSVWLVLIAFLLDCQFLFQICHGDILSYHNGNFKIYVDNQ